jgi:hypothetical protein
VQGSLGIFSDEIMRRHKFCFGYIPADFFNEEVLRQHLTTLGHTKARANRMIFTFKQQIRCAFWEMLMKPIVEAERAKKERDEDVILFILGKTCYIALHCTTITLIEGHGFNKVRVFVPFHVGDAPAQAYVAMSFAKAECLRCTYPNVLGDSGYNDCVVDYHYDKAKHKLRDKEFLAQKAITADHFIEMEFEHGLTYVRNNLL